MSEEEKRARAGINKPPKYGAGTEEICCCCCISICSLLLHVVFPDYDHMGSSITTSYSSMMLRTFSAVS